MKINFWRTVPVFRVLLPFLLGLHLGKSGLIPLSWFVSGATLGMMLMGAICFWPVLREHAEKLFAAVFLLVFVSLGGAVERVSDLVSHPEHLKNKRRADFVDLELLNHPEESPRSKKVTARVRGIYHADGYQAANARVLVYYRKEEVFGWKRGDRILVARTPQEVRPPMNPYEFDYRRYLYRRGITHTLFLRDPSEVRLLSSSHQTGFRNWVEDSRKALVGLLRGAVKDDDAFGVSAALILGQKDHLSREIRNAYSSSGAMHVLAVSGLHVGIIYMVLVWLLRWLGNRGARGWLRLFIIILALWSYALITGMSPSVMRASTMFTAIAIAQGISRSTNIYNSIAGAALVLICFNPLITEEVGFQLSFAAVLGIVLLQPKIYALWHTRNWLLDKLWQLTAVSIAAQLATFPLGIYYFHQFPNYFLLSNFIVIPAATVVLIAGFATMASGIIQPLYELLGTALNAIVSGLNWLIVSIENLPGSLTENLYFSEMMLVLVYVFLAFFTVMVYRPKVQTLRALTLLLVLMLTLRTTYLVELKNQRMVLVAHVPGSTCVNFVDGEQNIVVTDESLMRNPERLNFHLGNFWVRFGHSKPQFLTLQDDVPKRSNSFFRQGTLVSFHGKRLAIRSDEHSSPDQSTFPHLEMLVMDGKSKLFPDEGFVGDVILGSGYRYRTLCCNDPDNWTYDVRTEGARLWDMRHELNSGSSRHGLLFK